jgi:pimeloyl-ACP methyl ester carboxylesterase
MQKTIPYQNGILSYRKMGIGKPILLIHGFGEDSSIWNEQISFLEQYCQLIVPDLPGTGKSSLLAGNEVGITNYADTILSILQAEEIQSCMIFGHSMGGYITLDFAEKYTNHISAFGLINSTAFADSTEKKQSRLKGIELMEDYGASPFLKNTIPNLFANQYKASNPDQVTQFIKASAGINTKTCQQYYQAMMNRANKTDLLKGNPLPILFVLGTEDIAAPLSDLMLQIHFPLKASVHILDHVGHMSMMEATEKLNEYLLDFIISN